MGNRSGLAETEFTQVPAGHFDQIEISRDQVTIAGWILCPKEPLVRLEVLVNGGLLGEATPQERADVAKVHRWISHAGKSGFSFHQDDPSRRDSDLSEVEIRGVGRSGRIVSMIGLDNHGSRCTHPLPPEELFKLVGSPDAASYTSQGLKIFSDITSAIRRYDDLDRFTRVLDWGCGCGRLLTHLIPAFPDKDFSGCDLVPEAIDWCRTQFPEGSFEYAKTHPPLPFDNHSFDLVIASSVFTHLDRNLQQLWLDELARVLEPAGSSSLQSWDPMPTCAIRAPDGVEGIGSASIWPEGDSSREASSISSRTTRSGAWWGAITTEIPIRSPTTLCGNGRSTFESGPTSKEDSTTTRTFWSCRENRGGQRPTKETAVSGTVLRTFHLPSESESSRLLSLSRNHEEFVALHLPAQIPIQTRRPVVENLEEPQLHHLLVERGKSKSAEPLPQLCHGAQRPFSNTSQTPWSKASSRRKNRLGA